MTESNETLTRYLLGELSESDREALERRYFEDARLVDDLADAERALLDAYVRNQLAPPLRGRVEQVYLTDARRRERLRFVEALASTFDHAAVPDGSRHASTTGDPRWRAWLDAVWRPPPKLIWATATLLVVAIAGGIWLSSRSRQQTGEVVRTEVRSVPFTEPQTSPAVPEPSRPTPDAPPQPVVVTLALAIGPGVRSGDAGTPATLVIRPETSEVRLQLTLQARDYSSYGVQLRAVGGTEILRRTALRPTVGPPGATLTLTLPASRFQAGDYLLTLQGLAEGGEVDDLSQSFIRVEKR